MPLSAAQTIPRRNLALSSGAAHGSVHVPKPVRLFAGS